MTETITLPRTGEAPLRFQGELIATANGQFVGTRPTRPNVDWFEVSIYRVTGNSNGPRVSRFVVAVTYRKKLKGIASEQRRATTTDDPAGMFGAFDPLTLVDWPPDAEQFARKRESLRVRVLAQWQQLVSAVLAEFPQEL